MTITDQFGVDDDDDHEEDARLKQPYLDGKFLGCVCGGGVLTEIQAILELKNKTETYF